jgi:hypothetical protein
MYTKPPTIFGFMDIVVGLLFSILLIIIASYIADSRYKNDPCKKYFVQGLVLKIIGSVAVGLIYQYYYTGGDTINYFKSSRAIDNYLSDDFWGFWSSFFYYTFPGSDTTTTTNVYCDYGALYCESLAEITVYRISFLFYKLSFDTYMGTAILMAAFSYIGIWGIFRTFQKLFPNSLRYIAIGVLFVPSTFFWGSGILKDSICLTALGILIYFFYQLVNRNYSRALLFLPLAIIMGKIILAIKVYILLAAFGFLMLWWGLSFQNQIKNPILRIIIGPVFFIILLVGSIYAVIEFGATSERYKIDNVLVTAQAVSSDLQKDYYYAAGTADAASKGSVYKIPEFEPTLGGVLSVAPIAISTALFRPFLWEVNSPVLLLQALETTIFTLLLAWTLFRYGPGKVVSFMLKNPFLIFCFFFSLLFGFMVGLTSGNFGNMSRYRIPMLPFLVTYILLVVDIAGSEAKDLKKAKLEKRARRRMQMLE